MDTSSFGMFDVDPDCSITPSGMPINATKKLHIKAGAGSSLEIRGARAINRAIYIVLGENAHLSMGSGQMFNGIVNLNLQEPSRMSIGDDCLWANCILNTTDMHSILSASTGIRLNPAADITIGNRVWFAHDSYVLKGVEISDDTIVAAKSLVTAGYYPPNVILGGVPAKVLRSDVKWKAQLT